MLLRAFLKRIPLIKSRYSVQLLFLCWVTVAYKFTSVLDEAVSVTLRVGESINPFVSHPTFRQIEFFNFCLAASLEGKL